jgi:serine O-acetyltransferase
MRSDLEVLLGAGFRGPIKVLTAILFSPCYGTVARYRISAFCDKHRVLRWLSKVFWLLNVYLVGCHISPRARIGKGLHLPHPVGIVVGEGVVIGDYVTIYQNVTLGRRRAETSDYPTILDRSTLYSGACVVGKVRVGPGARVGANVFLQSDLGPDRTARS